MPGCQFRGLDRAMGCGGMWLVRVETGDLCGGVRKLKIRDMIWGSVTAGLKWFAKVSDQIVGSGAWLVGVLEVVGMGIWEQLGGSE